MDTDSGRFSSNIHVMHLFFIKLAVVDSGQRIMHASVPEVSLSLLQFRNIRDHAPEQIAAHQFLYAWDLHLFPITVGGYHPGSHSPLIWTSMDSGVFFFSTL